MTILGYVPWHPRDVPRSSIGNLGVARAEALRRGPHQWVIFRQWTIPAPHTVILPIASIARPCALRCTSCRDLPYE